MELSELIELESRVWEALQRGDQDADADLLGADFLGVYPSGFAGKQDHAGQLLNGPTVATFSILEPRMIRFTADHVLLAYRANYRRPDQSTEETMLVSSAWSNVEGRWVNVFSQDTVLDETADVP